MHRGGGVLSYAPSRDSAGVASVFGDPTVVAVLNGSVVIAERGRRAHGISDAVIVEGLSQGLDLAGVEFGRVDGRWDFCLCS